MSSAHPSSERLLHVFYVQSFISYFVCLAVIRHEGFCHDDVLFLFDRGFQAKTDYCAVDLPDFFGQPIRMSLRAIPANRRKSRKARCYLNKALGSRPFELYTNRMNQPSNHHIGQMPNHRGTNVYEEGFAAYHVDLFGIEDVEPVDLDFRQRILFALSGRPRPVTGGFYVDTYKRIYGTSPLAFRSFPRRSEVDLLPVIRSATVEGQFDCIARNATVFALPIPYDFVNDPNLSRQLENAIVASIEISGRNAYFKYHPDRYDHSAFWNDLADRVRMRAGVDMRSRTLPDLQLEVMAISRPDVVIAVILSSLAVYANIFQCSVLSFAKTVFGEKSRKVQKLISNSPGAIFVEPGDDHDKVRARLRAARTRKTEIGGTPQ